MTTVVVRLGPEGFRSDIEAGRHRLVADEPVAVGGTDEGPTPYDLLLAALGTCSGMTLRMYADRKGWPLESVEVRLRHTRVHEKDCEECETKRVGLDQVEREIRLTGALTVEQQERLLAIADRCPVKQTLGACVRVNAVANLD